MVEYILKASTQIQQCQCVFCKECLQEYLRYEIISGSYEITCPDTNCLKKGILHLEEINKIAGNELFEKHMDIRLNKEIVQDWRRARCPKPDCNTICYQGPYFQQNIEKKNLSWTFFSCPKCKKGFCSKCLDDWHPGMTCQELSADKNGTSLQANTIFESDLDIKYCPKCNLTIEKTGGCSHMICSRCWHGFCWICLESVPVGLLHYTYGNCKGKLNHTITTTESLLLFTIILLVIIATVHAPWQTAVSIVFSFFCGISLNVCCDKIRKVITRDRFAKAHIL